MDPTNMTLDEISKSPAPKSVLPDRKQDPPRAHRKLIYKIPKNAKRNDHPKTPGEFALKYPIAARNTFKGRLKWVFEQNKKHHFRCPHGSKRFL